MRLVLAFLMFVFVLVACFGPTFVVQQYSGPQRPAESIAILRVNGSDSVRLVFLDGADVAAPIVSDGRLHIELLPALHTLEVGDAARVAERFPAIGFRAEANRVYRVFFVLGEPRVYEVDRSSDRSLRDVTITDVPQRRPIDLRSPVPAAGTVMNPFHGSPEPPSPIADAGALEGRDE